MLNQKQFNKAIRKEKLQMRNKELHPPHVPADESPYLARFDHNFKGIVAGAQQPERGKLALVECWDNLSESKVAVVCFVLYPQGVDRQSADSDMKIQLIPLARMLTQAQIDAIDPPDPSGGYRSNFPIPAKEKGLN
jgi:hypothetical protein